MSRSLFTLAFILPTLLTGAPPSLSVLTPDSHLIIGDVQLQAPANGQQSALLTYREGGHFIPITIPRTIFNHIQILSAKQYPVSVSGLDGVEFGALLTDLTLDLGARRLLATYAHRLVSPLTEEETRTRTFLTSVADWNDLSQIVLVSPPQKMYPDTRRPFLNQDNFVTLYNGMIVRVFVVRSVRYVAQDEESFEEKHAFQFMTRDGLLSYWAGAEDHLKIYTAPMEALARNRDVALFDSQGHPLLASNEPHITDLEVDAYGNNEIAKAFPAILEYPDHELYTPEQRIEWARRIGRTRGGRYLSETLHFLEDAGKCRLALLQLSPDGNFPRN